MINWRLIYKNYLLILILSLIIIKEFNLIRIQIASTKKSSVKAMFLKLKFFENLKKDKKN